MAPQLTSNSMESTSSHPSAGESISSWAQSDFDSSWDTDYSSEQLLIVRGRETTRQTSHRHSRRSKSDDHHHFIAPQYTNLSPDIRKSRKQQSQSQPQSQQRRHSSHQQRLNAHLDDCYGTLHSSLEPDFLELSPASSRDARSLSPLRPPSDIGDSSISSRERLNLFPSPMKSPVLHKSESIQLQAQRAARSKPMTIQEVSLLREAPDNKKKKMTDSLLMFGDFEDAASVMTGVSQQELIVRERNNTTQKRRDKRYRSKPKKKGVGDRVRILNLPSSFKANGNSPARKKYQKGVPEDDEEDNDVNIEQAPLTTAVTTSSMTSSSTAQQQPRTRNLLSRYSKRKTGALAAVEPVECIVPGVNDRRNSWRSMSPHSSGRSIGVDSTHSGLSTKSEELAQAAENWIKSNEETHAAQFTSAIDIDEIEEDDDDEFVVSERQDLLEFAAGFDSELNSISTNGSDEEEPRREESGAFPTLNDNTRIAPPPATARLLTAFQNQETGMKQAIDNAEWPDTSVPSSSDWFVDTNFGSQDTRAIAAWDGRDKISDEESPVSVMAVDGTMIRNSLSSSAKQPPPVQQTRRLPPPPSLTASQRQRRPRSILRQGRHSGAKEVAAKVQSVKSARVKFHDQVVRSMEQQDASFQQQEQTTRPVDVDNVALSEEDHQAYKNSYFDFSLQHENPRTQHTAPTSESIPPEDLAYLLERDGSVLSAIPESEHSLQTEPSVISPQTAGSVASGEASESIHEHEKDEWVLDEHERASFGDFGQLDPHLPTVVQTRSQSPVPEKDRGFVETVASIVIQTAARRMLAINVAERMLMELYTLKKGKVAYEENLGIVPPGSERSPPKLPAGARRAEASRSKREAHGDSDATNYNYDERFVAFPVSEGEQQRDESFSTLAGRDRDFAAFPSPQEKKQPLRIPPSATDVVRKKPASFSDPRNTSTASGENRDVSFSSTSVQVHRAASAELEETFAAFPSVKERRERISRSSAIPKETVAARSKPDFPAFPPVSEEPRASLNNVPPMETSPARRERDSVTFPSVAALRNGFASSSTDQLKEAAPVKNDRPPAKAPNHDAFPSKMEKDFEILPVKATDRLQINAARSEDMPLEAVPYHLYDIAATQIQAVFRGWWMRDSLNVDHFCACRIQRAYRSFKARMSFVFDIYRIAIVQSLWRRKLAQRKVEQMRLENVELLRVSSMNHEADVDGDDLPVAGSPPVAERKNSEGLSSCPSSHLDPDYDVESIKREAMTSGQSQSNSQVTPSRNKGDLPANPPQLDPHYNVESVNREGIPQAPVDPEEIAKDSLRIRAIDDAAATTIQSQWRTFDARRKCLDQIVNILIVQSVARRWLAQRVALSKAFDKQHALIVEEENSNDAVAPDNDSLTPQVTNSNSEEEEIQVEEYGGIPLPVEVPRQEEIKETIELPRDSKNDDFTPIVPGASSDSYESQQSFPEHALPVVSPDKVSNNKGTIDAVPALTRATTDDTTESKSNFISRVGSEAEHLVTDSDGQQWVKVSNSYDEESFLQSYVSKEKSSAVSKSTVTSLDSKDKTEVTKLSADELIELFINMSTTEAVGRSVTPLRMESPVNEGSQPARSVVSVASSTGTPSKAEGRPPRMEKTPEQQAIVDKEVLLAKEKVDRMNAKLAAGNARKGAVIEKV